MNELRMWMGGAVIWLALHGMAAAAPVAAEHIPAEARWFCHFNLDTVRALPGVAEWLARCASDPAAQARLAAWSDKLGMNPREDLLGVTLFSSQYAGGTGVALIHLRKLDRDKLITALRERHPDCTTAEHGARTLYTWTTRSRHGPKQLTGAFGNDQTLVIGTSADEVKQALDTLDGNKPAHAQDSPLLAGISPNALFVSRGIGVLAADRAATRCPVIRACESAFVQWQQQNGALTAEYRIEAESPEQARAFQTVVDGLVAFARLRGGNSEAVSRLLAGLSYGAQGNRFDLTWKADLEDLRRLVEQFQGGCPTR